MDFKTLLEQYKNDEIDTQKVLDSIEENKSGMVPRSRLNDKNNEIKDLKEEISNRDNQIAQLEKSVTDESEIQKELEKVKQDNADWETKYQKSQLNNAIKLAVAKDAINADHVLKLLDTDGLELQDDGTVKGLDDKLEAFKSENGHLFGADKPKGSTPQDGNNPTGGITKEQFEQMGISEREQLFVNDRPTYDQLIQN